MDEKLELARVVLRQGEIRLEAQLQITLAAASRATTLAALFATLAAAALAIAAGPANVASTSGGPVQVAAIVAIAANSLEAAFFFEGSAAVFTGKACRFKANPAWRGGEYGVVNPHGVSHRYAATGRSPGVHRI